MKKLTSLQWAAIAAIRQCASVYREAYRFVGSEKRIAERLVEAGCLRPDKKAKANGIYTVTAKGEKAYLATLGAR